MSNSILTCECGQKNRVPALPPGKVALCGACREPLDVPSLVVCVNCDDEFDEGDEDAAKFHDDGECLDEGDQL